MEIMYLNEHFYSDDVVKYLTFTGSSQNVFLSIIQNKEIKKKAQELKVEVSIEEIQKFADNYRIIHDLHTEEETLKFFDKSGLSIDDFEYFCETTLLITKLKDYIADEQKIEDYFIKNHQQYDKVRISNMLLKNINQANEIKMQIKEDGKDFHVLARKHSLDRNNKYAYGYIGIVSRDMVHDEIVPTIFTAKKGDLLGPFEHGTMYQLIYVEDVFKAELTEEISQIIKETIYEQWLKSFLKKGIVVSS